MSYLELPPEELTALAKEFRQKYNLIISERPARVVLVWADMVEFQEYTEIDWFKPVYRFSLVNKNGQKEFIAFQNSKDLVVTDNEQYEFFSQFKIVKERLRCKIWQMFAQLCRENDLIEPEWPLN
ncbi:MAG: hypothetical protein ACXAC5_03835 [Promethearchaeota archaeon]|jgi:hypothetical protein